MELCSGFLDSCRILLGSAMPVVVWFYFMKDTKCWGRNESSLQVLEKDWAIICASMLPIRGTYTYEIREKESRNERHPSTIAPNGSNAGVAICKDRTTVKQSPSTWIAGQPLFKAIYTPNKTAIASLEKKSAPTGKLASTLILTTPDEGANQPRSPYFWE